VRELASGTGVPIKVLQADAACGYVYGATLKQGQRQVVEGCVKALRDDKVCLIAGVDQIAADAIIAQVCDQLSLRQMLELQAEYAAIHGHRSKVSKYFMTVNRRKDFQLVTPHSEGGRNSNIQLSSFYCRQNTTDGGETILLKVNSEGGGWNLLKEYIYKISEKERKLSATDAAIAKMRYQISLPEGSLSEDDMIIEEKPSPFGEISMYTVLCPVTKAYSSILNSETNVFWDNVSSIDNSSFSQFTDLLRGLGILKAGDLSRSNINMDTSSERRVWSSGMEYSTIFEIGLFGKLRAGDLIIQNNLTWTHGANNWTPGSGIREILAAFA